nr:hypothetical protein [Desulfobulbaceae bacterium]
MLTKLTHRHSYKNGFTQELQEAIRAMKAIETIIPICSFCGHVRQDNGVWAEDTSVNIDLPGVNHSHGICPSCVQKQFPQQYQAIIKQAASR